MTAPRSLAERVATVKSNRTRALALVDGLLDEAHTLESVDLIERWNRTREVLESAYAATLRLLEQERGAA